MNPFDLTEAIATIEREANGLRSTGAKLLTLGGDHTIALPLLRSVHRDHGPIAVLHFDAHLDIWDTYFRAPYTHGTPFRRASEEGLLDRAVPAHRDQGAAVLQPGPATGRGARVPDRAGRRLRDRRDRRGDRADAGTVE